MPLVEIKEKYSDVKFFASWWRDGFPPVFSDANDLEEKWGKADKVETKWLQKLTSSVFGIGLVVYSALTYPNYFLGEALAGPFPQEKHHWYKGGTHVEVTIINRGFEGYEKKVAYWEWEKIQSGENKLVKK